LEILEGKRPFGKHRRRWEDNIKMDFKETGLRAAEWIRLVHNRNLVYTANLQGSMKCVVLLS
jgi:hypothetical protein